MDIDLHLHTTFSDCSSLSYETVCEYVEKQMPLAITITDHGSVKACARLSRDFPELCVLWGVEVTAEEGDFLIFSEDTDYLSSLTVFHRSVCDLRRDEHNAVIWAHPRVPQSSGWTGPDPISKEILEVARHIDGLELYNGTMLFLATMGSVRQVYFDRLQQIATSQKLTCTAGSDAHEKESFFKCWTTFPESADTPRRMIDALKQGKVVPHYDRERFGGLQIQLLPEAQRMLGNG
ncbi:MAG: PHP-associated domain-containing protein [Candidatus Alcyoniella australis]|nr:PHP-associated domain-containing protein [Candidatus Alcyoniella australis]